MIRFNISLSESIEIIPSTSNPPTQLFLVTYEDIHAEKDEYWQIIHIPTTDCYVLTYTKVIDNQFKASGSFSECLNFVVDFYSYRRQQRLDEAKSARVA